jgi:hypothetical protein
MGGMVCCIEKSKISHFQSIFHSLGDKTSDLPGSSDISFNRRAAGSQRDQSLVVGASDNENIELFGRLLRD